MRGRVQRGAARTPGLMALGLAMALTVGVSGCGDDDDSAVASGTIEVVARDFRFDGVPATVRSGTTFTLTNEGAEPHELLIIRIPDDENRPLDELIELPDDELFEVFGGEPMPTMILIASPGPPHAVHGMWAELTVVA